MILIKNDYFQYTVTDDFKVHCWELEKNPETDNPFWFQHQHPSGEPWQNLEQIDAWLLEKFVLVEESPLELTESIIVEPTEEAVEEQAE